MLTLAFSAALLSRTLAYRMRPMAWNWLEFSVTLIACVALARLALWLLALLSGRLRLATGVRP